MDDETFDYQQQQDEEHQKFDGDNLVWPPVSKNVKITEIIVTDGKGNVVHIERRNK